MSFDEWLAARGFTDAEGLTDSQRSGLLADWKVAATAAPEPPKTDDLDSVITTGRAEKERRKRIANIVAGVIAEQPQMLDLAEALGRQAVEAGWTTERFELEILRARRPGAPALAIREDAETSDSVIEAAVCMAGGLAGLEAHYTPATLDAARRRWSHGLGLEELLLTYARKGGCRSLSVKGNLRPVLQAAFDTDIQAAGSWGPSTNFGLSGVLSNVANKFLREAFMAVESVWTSIAARRSVSDFKQISTYALTGGLSFLRVPPAGEIKHGMLGAETYTNQIDTRGRMLGIDRRDLINDDLGALTGANRRLGRGAATGINTDFWGIFLNNSTFFTAGRNNLLTGAGSALSITGLDAALTKFMLQTDPDGEPLGAMPTILLVPPALAATATQLMSPMLIAGTGTTPITGSSNPFAGRFRVLSSAYMQSASLTGNSATAWYLLADPNDIPVIEVAYLNGADSPTVESAEADFASLGIALRAYWDYGCSLQEFRGGIKSAGA